MPTVSRRIIGAVLCTLALLLPGCSMVRVGYGQAPDLLFWWLDGYADFNPEQSAQVRDALDGLFRWHRRTQLTDYAALLQRAQVQLAGSVAAGEVCAWQDEFSRRVDSAVEQALPAAAEIVPTLSAAQLAHIERKFAKVNEESKADFAPADRVERQRGNIKRWSERFESMYGPLSDTQSAAVARGVAASPSDPEVWIGERLARQREILQTLRGMAAGAAPNAAANSAANASPTASTSPGAGRASREASLRALAERSRKSPRPAYNAYAQRVAEHNCRLMAELHNSMSAAQRERARARLKGWEEDLRALAVQGAP